MDVSFLLDGLNDAQRDAITAPRENMLVLAGAGSGKTRVLVHRIGWMLNVEGVSPYGILAVTFTNKAAKEMRGRVESLLGSSERGMWIGTFHGIAHRLLKNHWKEAGLKQNFQVIDTDDQLRIIKRILKEQMIDEAQFPPKQLVWFIGAQKDEGRRAAHIDARDPIAKTQQKIYLAYENVCERSGLVDFGELLLRAHELWLNQPALLQHYQARFSYILVDEFQDTNTIQYAWLRVLSGGKVPVMAVGDDDQSIYGWRGAKVENIRQFSRDFAGAHTVRLEQNYRSTGNILKAANAVIENNNDRMGKSLWTSGDDGELIKVYAAYNEQDEAGYINDQICEWKKSGRRLDESAILYRSNAQSRVLEEALLRSGTPYRIYGGQRFYERLEIKNVLSYLRLINNRDDDQAMERVINTPTRGIGDKTVETIRRYAREEGLSLWAAAMQACERGVLAPRATHQVKLFLDLVEEMSIGIDEISLDEIAEQALTMSGLLEFHQKEKGEKGQARVENLRELIGACKSFEHDKDEETSALDQYLAAAALDAGDRQADEFDDAVQLMTMHSAKGLEFPLVFIAGLEEGLFPHKMSMDEGAGLEEERRLAYVGMTRAKEQLVMCWAESRRLYGTENRTLKSRFVSEVPNHHIHEVRLSASITPSFTNTSMPNAMKQKTEPASGIGLGQLVLHPSFGDGIVLSIEGEGARARVQINFDTHGVKWLLLSHANLTPM